MKDFEKNFENALSIRLTKVEKSEMFEQPDLAKLEKSPLMEFHVSKAMRDKCDFDLSLFATTGNVILTNFKNVRLFAKKINDQFDPVLESSKMVKAGQLNAMGLIDEIFHYVCTSFRKQENAKAFEEMVQALDEKLGKKKVDKLLAEFTEEFPPTAVYRGEISAQDYLAGSEDGVSNRVTTFEEIFLLHHANENPAFEPFYILFNDEKLAKNPDYAESWEVIKEFFKTQPVFGPNNNDLVTMLKEPVVASPNSLKGQLDYIRKHWGLILGEWLLRLLSGIDMIQEEEKPGWNGNFSGLPPMEIYNYDSLNSEYERFTPDREWMPRVVLMAKTVLVWLNQLSEKYKRPITRLDQIPDEELDTLAQEGFTGLWLIGLWERSWGSKRIKQICGNPEAAASAYSLHDYDIAGDLGGWEALDNLRKRLWYRGIRLASDMVPNHTGLDAKWVVERPDLFIQSYDCPFPSYTFNGENLSLDPRVSVYLEDHYYSKNDCAVVFKRVDNATGEVRYIYHGNDGTGMPWNDTAQIDFLNPTAREAVMQEILHVARNFPIIRFDAAMVLAKKHIKRLWYPEPGQGGDIASRAEHAVSREDFEIKIPNEFWREVVDRIQTELPDTLLLAEAFWMMEGYFVRTLGMHRVYNSAFMNMLKREENFKYRATVKNTLEFDPGILKRYVNFMNNPDEETAVAQFGKGDKYFGVCTLMVTMPGLPMFGHGQIEGFQEKYGMEFTKAYWNETPDLDLLEKHKRDIFPLMKKRYLFAEVENFRFYDVWDNGRVNENVYAYSNRFGDERSIVFYNNVYEQASGWINRSTKYAKKDENGNITHECLTLGEALDIPNEDNKYLIFQEQKSGLWFIRSCRDIHQNGLYVHLNGFEYQVLLNISCVSDDETGKYRVLFETLNGRGVPDIDIALKEIFLKDLYRALTDFASRELFDGIGIACMSKEERKEKNIKDVKLADVLDRVKPLGIKYFETLVNFIEGNYGSSTVLAKDEKGERLSYDEIWKNFVSRINALVKITELDDKKAKDDAGKLGIYLNEGLAKRDFMVELLTGFIMLYSVRDVIGSKASATDTKNLINLWCLDRKIRDILVEFGKPSKDMYTSFKTLLETAKFCDYKITAKNCNQMAYDIMNDLVHSDMASTVLGVNMYDSVLWFNKERLEDAIWAGTMLYTIFAAKPADYANVYNVDKLIFTAVEGSEYRAEKLVELLKPAVEEKPKKAKAEKTTAKKTTSKAKK
ncbi:MAG: alpha-amylase family glycosyl hydrolase [Treponemataceae bacterium]|nr:alpha-amylase family glycosyl hydrolase [Treponemataceae bacterium]